MRKIRFRFSLFFACLLSGNVRKYKVLCAQQILESGNLNSALSVDLKNPFSMGYPVSRKSWNCGAYNGGISETEPEFWSIYCSYFQACWDRLLWDKANRIKYTSWQDYIQQVSDLGYAFNPNYLKDWMNSFEEVKYGWIMTVFIVLWLSFTVYLTSIYFKVRGKKGMKVLYLIPWILVVIVGFNFVKNKSYAKKG